MTADATLEGVSRPRLGLVDLVVLLWRAKWLMVLIFAAIFGAGLWYAVQLPGAYVATSRVHVSLSEEYVFRPRVGEGVQNNVPENAQLVLSEIDLMHSPIVFERVMERLGLETVYPKTASRLAVAPEDKRYETEAAALEQMAEEFSAFSAPNGSVIQATFTHPDPQRAADVLNAILDEYVAYRAEIFEDTSPISLERQRREFEGQLREAEQDLLGFLNENGLSDFDTERRTVQELFSSVEQAILTNEAQQSEHDGRGRVLAQQLETIEPLVDIFVEDSTAQSIVALELEREELLTRYTPGSKTLQDINQRIARAQQFRNDQSGTLGTVRRGPNPVYQELETAYGTARSQAAAARQEGLELARQALLVETRQKRIVQLEPQWQALVRKRDLLEQNTSSFATREAEARALAEIARQGSDNIRVLERARRPVKNSSPKLLVAIGALFFAGFCALMLGLLFALTRKGFVTPASLERTLGLPVVSTVRRYK